MGIFNLIKGFVALSTVTTFLCLLFVTPTYSSICQHGEFLHQELQKCLNCTECDNERNEVVIRPCQVHLDTVCGPLSKLWDVLYPENRRRHRHQDHTHRQKKHEETITVLNKWKLSNVSIERENISTATYSGISQEDDLSDIIVVTSTEMPFSIMEALVWDWQAIALTFAVFSCTLFFLVITFYSCHQAKQWKRLKENFDFENCLRTSSCSKYK